MAWSPLDTRWWNLSLAAVATTAAACGPTITLDDDGNSETLTEGSTDSESDTDPEPPNPTGPAPDCVNNSDCPNGYECIDQVCISTGYCDDGYCCYDDCCYDGCCDGGCYYYECYGAEDCEPGSLCDYQYGGGYCATVDTLPECGSPLLLPVPVEQDQEDAVVSLSLVNAYGDDGEDLVVAHESGATTLYPRAGVAPPVALPLAPGDAPVAVVAGNFNGDEFPDLAAFMPDTRVVVLAGDAVGNFSVFSETPGTDLASDFAAIDWNGDGWTDLTGINPVGDSWVILGGKGGFTEIFGLSGGKQTDALGVGHFDDGQENDIVISRDNLSYLYFGEEEKTFEPSEIFESPLYSNSQLAVGDFDGTGLSDFITTSSELGWTLIDGWTDGEPDAPIQFALLRNTDAADAGDFNGDGRSDAMLLDGSTASILYGTPVGSIFECVSTVELPFAPSAMAIGDYNADGPADVVVSNGSDVVVLLGS